MEMDLKKILGAVARGWKIVVASVAAFAVLTVIVTQFFLTPMYTSNTSVYIKLDDSSAITQTNLNLARSIVDTYDVILESDTVLNDVCDKIKGRTSKDYSMAEIKSMKTSGSINGTEVVRISITCADPEDAQIIADQLVASAEPVIADIMKIKSFEVLDYASLPASPSSPSMIRNIAVAVLLALVLSCVGLILLEMLDKRVKDPSVLSDTLGVPLIGVIPKVKQQ